MKVSDPVRHYMRDAEIFDYFAEQSGPDRDTTRRLRQAILADGGFARSQKVLDIGSGDGWLAGSISRRGCIVVSVDAGLHNLRRLRNENRETLCVCASAERLPFRPSIFDRIVASEVLEHLNEPRETIGQAHDLLKPGGLVVASTPHRERIRTYLCVHCNKPTPANAHIHSFDEERHRAMFIGCGFHAPETLLIQSSLFVASRLSYLTRFLPYRLWRVLDRCCMLFRRKANTIVVKARRDE
jgi:SAM-dependent methyltransferase